MMPYIVGGAGGLLYLVAYFAYRWFVKKPAPIRTPRREAGASGVFESAELARLEEREKSPALGAGYAETLKKSFAELYKPPFFNTTLFEPIVGGHVVYLDAPVEETIRWNYEDPTPPRKKKILAARVLRVDPDKLEWKRRPDSNDWDVSFGNFKASITGDVIEHPTNFSALSPIELSDVKEAFFDEYELLPREYSILSVDSEGSVVAASHGAPGFPAGAPVFVMVAPSLPPKKSLPEDRENAGRIRMVLGTIGISASVSAPRSESVAQDYVSDPIFVGSSPEFGGVDVFRCLNTRRLLMIGRNNQRLMDWCEEDVEQSRYAPGVECLRLILVARSACKDTSVGVPKEVRSVAGDATFLGYGCATGAGEVFLFHDEAAGRYFTVDEHWPEVLFWADAEQVDALPEDLKDNPRIREFEPRDEKIVRDKIFQAAIKIHPEAEIDRPGEHRMTYLVRFKAPGIRFVLGAVDPRLYGWETT